MDLRPFSEKTITELVSSLTESREKFGEYLEKNCWNLVKIATETSEVISQEISKRLRKTREQYFLVMAKEYCNALDNEDFEYASVLLEDLGYFQYFLRKDSLLGRIKLDNQNIRDEVEAYYFFQDQKAA